MREMDDIKQLAALQALNTMFAKGWVNVSAIRDVAKILNVNLGGDAYDILSALHCVHLTDMQPELRERIPDLVRESLSLSPTYQFVTLRPKLAAAIEVRSEPEPEQPKQARGMMRLLTTKVW